MSESIEPKEVQPYEHMSGALYDLIYSSKDYEGQARKLKEIIQARCESGGNSLLEAACGTGTYMKCFQDEYEVDGFDLSSGQVAAAQARLPEARIEVADMVDFDMSRTYDVVACLFSSIGYLVTKDRLDQAIQRMEQHTKSGGLVIVEPWLSAEIFKEGHVSHESAAADGTTISRIGISTREGMVTTTSLHHMVGTAQGVDHFVELNTLAMYTDEDFTDAFTKAGLSIEIDPEGLTGRRLCIGKKPL